MPDNFAKHIQKCGLGKYRDTLMRFSKPSIELVGSKSPITVGCSKFGGSPDLPRGFEWPHHDLGPYRFIGQINLSEIPKSIRQLPDTGLLSFFYAHDEEGEVFCGDPDYVRVFRFDIHSQLQTVAAPEAVRFGACRKIALESGTDVLPWPRTSAEEESWPIDECDHDAYWKLRLQLHPGRGYLLGYPFNTTLAFDPTPGPEWESLLTLGSDDNMEWCWHDGDWLVTFIETQRLQEGDFSHIGAIEG